MHYLSILEGRLKYETINFESTITFVLYNKDVDKKNEIVDKEDLVYFLKSEVDVVITLNMASNKIFLSAPLTQTISLFSKNGKQRDVISEREILLTDDIVKFKIEDVEFSFLIDAVIDPEKKEAKLNETNVKRFDIKNYKNHIIITGFVFVIVLSALFIFFQEEKEKASPVIVFNNEVEMMRANLSKMNSSEILVKTQLDEEVRLYLEQQGYRYVKFELEEEKQDKFNLILYVFQNEKQPFDTVVNKIRWIGGVVVKQIDIRNMFDDFNRLANKYDLKPINDSTTMMRYQLVEVSFVNDNLRFYSLQRDLNDFTERWGQNYIEFNVNLKQLIDSPVNFILKDGNEEIIKSNQGFFIN